MGQHRSVTLIWLITLCISSQFLIILCIHSSYILFLGEFVRSQKATFNFVTSSCLCLSVRPCHGTNLCLVWYWGLVWESVGNLGFSFKSDKKYRALLHDDLSTSIVTGLLTYLLTYLLTPWCRVLLEKPTGLQLVKKFPAFHGTRRFITALTSVRHLSLSWVSPVQSIYPHPISWRSILILSIHLRLGLSSGLLPSGFMLPATFNFLHKYCCATLNICILLTVTQFNYTHRTHCCVSIATMVTRTRQMKSYRYIAHRVV